MGDAPKGLGTAGRSLWSAVTALYELEQHELVMLGGVCVVADRVQALDAVVDADGVVLHTDRGLVPHPALVEGRQQRITQQRLLSAMRLPNQDGKVPQHRGIRGVYQGGRSGTA